VPTKLLRFYAFSVTVSRKSLIRFLIAPSLTAVSVRVTALPAWAMNLFRISSAEKGLKLSVCISKSAASTAGGTRQNQGMAFKALVAAIFPVGDPPGADELPTDLKAVDLIRFNVDSRQFSECRGEIGQMLPTTS
jgi:hypothetical protein